MLKDYAKCLYLESKADPARIIGIACGLWQARSKYNIGPLHYSLFRLAHTPSTQWGEYMRDTEFFARVIRCANSDRMLAFLKNKARFYQHCLDHGLPTPTIVCMVPGPRVEAGFSRTIPYADNLERWKLAMKSAPDELFVKLLDGSYGSGAFAIRRHRQHHVFGPDETRGSLADIYRYMTDRLKNQSAFLVQPRIRSHPELQEVSSVNGLPTVRVVTAMVNGQPKILFACIKLTVGANATDNFSHGSTGNLAVAIDVRSGALAAGWCSSRRDWPLMQSMDVHPDTGNRIRGKVLPLWNDVVDLALAGQATLPDMKTVGWDIAITGDGVMVIEANGGYNIDILQVSHQRGLGADFLSLIEPHADSAPRSEKTMERS